jgi:hypothetical protein
MPSLSRTSGLYLPYRFPKKNVLLLTCLTQMGFMSRASHLASFDLEVRDINKLARIIVWCMFGFDWDGFERREVSYH